MSTSWLGDQLSPFAPGFWLVLGVLGTILLGSLQELIAARWRGLVWFAHWLLVPYLGLLLGGLSPRLLGLASHDWLAGLGLGLGLIFAVVTLLTLARALTDLGAPVPSEERRGEVLRLGWHTISSTLLWCGIEQFHWSFLRGAVWEMLQTLPEPPALVGYWAIWCAAGVILLELLLLRPGFFPLLIQLVALTTTSILFFYTRNFWLCWALHAAVHLLTTPPTLLPLAPLRLAFIGRSPQ
jgi:hypothetical protein